MDWQHVSLLPYKLTKTTLLRKPHPLSSHLKNYRDYVYKLVDIPRGLSVTEIKPLAEQWDQFIILE